jgi:hypothetical protein
MYGSELRTCGLGAVVCVLLGAGIGYGWHYLDNGGVTAIAASVSTPLAKQNVPGPPPPNPPPRETPVLDVPQLPGLSHYPQPARSHPRCAKGHACGKHQPDGLGATSPQA